MNPKATVITKIDLIITAKKKGIKEPHKMPTKNYYTHLIGTKKACAIQYS